VFVTDEEAARDPRMKPGCSVPITIGGRRVGTFGLTGPLDVAQPLTRVASAVLASWLDEQRRQSALKHSADEVLTGVKAVSSRAEHAASEAAAVVQQMTSTSRDAAEKVQKSDAILRTVQEIAQTSRILSINGSVEAARAGEHGRGFAVVAREMLELAEHARGAATQIQGTLGEVQRAIAQLQGAIDRSAKLAEGQAGALGEVQGVVMSLQQAIAELAKG
jgi:methyl-accepting chemotaxis protein